MATLFDLLSTTRFLLHDTNTVIFQDNQLINAINLARDQIVGDTSTPQAIVQVPLVAGQEAYPYATTIQPAVQAINPTARAIQAVLGVNFVQAPNLKQPLTPYPWSTLNEIYRQNPVNSLPEAFGPTDIGGSLGTLYIEPAPSTGTWFIEVRCVWLPSPLATYQDVEQAIPSPIAESCIPVLACKWASLYDDDKESADHFEESYLRLLMNMAAAMPPFATVPYSSIY